MIGSVGEIFTNSSEAMILLSDIDIYSYFNAN